MTISELASLAVEVEVQQDIERRKKAGGGANQIEYALYTHNGYWYPVWRGQSSNKAVKTHQSLLISKGEDPAKVFSNGESQAHHVNGCIIDNRPDNLELLSREEHMIEHGFMEADETDWNEVYWSPGPLSGVS